MYGFWRLGLSPAPSAGAAAVANGDEDEEKSEKARHPAENRHGPREDVARQPAVQGDRGRAHSREDEQPEEKRALLTAPEGRERVAKGQLDARVVGDVGQREVVVGQGSQEDDGRDGHGPERGEEGVARRFEQAPSATHGSDGPRDGRIEQEPESDDERGAAELRHQEGLSGPSGAYFDGHFVTSESRSATKTPFSRLPRTEMSRPGLKRSGTKPWYTTGTVALPPMSRRWKRMPASCASPLTGPTTTPARLTVPEWSASWLGRIEGVPPPAMLV
jgi:hypothetical protein